MRVSPQFLQGELWRSTYFNTSVVNPIRSPSDAWPTFVVAHLPASSSIQLSATGRLLDNSIMCYEFRTPLLPGLFRQTKQSDLSVTSTLQSVSRWRYNEYSCCPHPLPFVQLWGAPVFKVRLVVWRSDLIGEGDLPVAGWWMCGHRGILEHQAVAEQVSLKISQHRTWEGIEFKSNRQVIVLHQGHFTWEKISVAKSDI